ncbi:hypothetical protein BYT27DRAFT_7334025 [Phlegmacium glaucopus]|nr:hypothetical protein BYT27DRAFT_7334025 [Phlegmacium glaucopus]
MSSIVIPKPVREPSSEWSSSTPNAPEPQAVSSPKDQIASNPTTPGLHVPGAFPGNIPKSGDDIQQDTEYVKHVAISAFQTAKGYAPTGVEDIKRLIQNAGDTVGGYLAESVAAYFPHHTPADTSLPSDPDPLNVRPASLGDVGTHPVNHTTNTSLPSEETSQNTHPNSSIGAGVLPGPPGEFCIAMTPDERISPPTPEYTSPPTSHGPKSDTVRSETGIAILPEERRQQNLPSHDDEPSFATEKGKSVSTGGVGALPGDKEEVSVALLPEEGKSLVGTESGASTDVSTRLLRGTPSTIVQDRDTSQYTLPVTGSSSLAPIPIRNYDKNTTGSPLHASHPITPNTTARTYALASDDVKFKGVPLSEGSHKEVDVSPTEKSIGERRNLEQGQSDVATSGCGAAVGPSSHAGHEGVRRKTGFMDKLKGEVKVISGKLLHKESQVEEGKRMMGKA